MVYRRLVYGQFFENVMLRNKKLFRIYGTLLKQDYVRCNMDNVRIYFD